MRKNFLLLLSLMLFSAGCGGSGNESSRAAPVSFNACTLLNQMQPETLLGEPVGAPETVAQSEGPVNAVSHCIVRAKSFNKSLYLNVTYAASLPNPKNKEDFIMTAQGLEQEIQKGGEVDGLGDFAVWYRAGGVSLAVFWKEHYRLMMGVEGMQDETRALEIAKSVAWQVLKSVG